MPTVAEVRAFAPYLPTALIDLVLEEWIETGDFSLAVAAMRESPTYQQFFPGNRREDGSLRYDEQTYLGLVDAFSFGIFRAGVNPDLFTAQFVQLIEGEVSPTEFTSRIDALQERVLLRADSMREYYARVAGIDVTDAALIASAIDPAIAQAILQRRITIAEIGAEATSRSFELGVDVATRLQEFGVDRGGASQLFATAQEAVPLGDVLARRHFDPDDTFDLGEFLDAFAFGSPAQTRRLNRLLRAETSLFSPQSPAGVLTGPEAEVVGLRPR